MPYKHQLTEPCRYPNWPRSRNSAISSNDSAASPEFSLPATEIHREQRALHLSVLQTGAMQRAHARRWTDVSCFLYNTYTTENVTNIISVVGYRHLILRVEFAKRTT